MKSRIQSLLADMSEGVYQKDAELSLSLLAALAGESVILLGPPGVAKSMVARRLKTAFACARSFEYLMSRFSTPDEIFGPVSIQRLRDSDEYSRCVDGYLPTADVVFLDEIWKAGPAIQNTLLTVINEKTYLNGRRTLQLPLKLLIGASNELPVQGEGLEALWDRFLIRLLCQPISDEELFYKMVCPKATPQATESTLFGDDDAAATRETTAQPITAEEYAAWQRQIGQVTVPRDVLLAITAIRRALHDVKVDGQDAHRDIYVSDRRWKKIVHLLQASAFVHDRQEVAPADLQLAIHCLWNEPDELTAVGRIVAEAIFGPYSTRIDALQRQVSGALQIRSVHDVLDDARDRGDHRDDDVIIYDGLYYAIAPQRDMQDVYIYIPDFKMLPTRSADEPAVRGVMFKDPTSPRRTLIRAYTNPDNVGLHDVELTRVNLYRDSMCLYVNGTRCPLRRATGRMALEQPSGLQPKTMGEKPLTLEELEGAVDALFREASGTALQLRQHLFGSSQVLQIVTDRMDAFKRQTARLRADIRRLLYDE